MRTTPISIEVLILFLLAVIPWPGPSVFKVTCSRDNSKIVRKVIQSKWLPVLEKFQVKLPLECPFHPWRDMFGPQHAAKTQHRASQWTCAFCGKSFYEERHLDNHFDHRHKSQINMAEDAVCLADYCDIMRCQVLVAHGVLSGGTGPSTDIEVWQDSETSRRALTPAGPRSMATVPGKKSRRLKPSVVLTPTVAPGCAKGDDKKTPDEKHTEESEADANHTAELCDADTLESSTPHRDARQEQLADLEAQREACDPVKLQKLKVRCESIVHSCVATLVIHLTQNQFKELEDEMQRAVCWYLSCDRYWEDTAPSGRSFPWPLLLALATGLALALCMCYYIIWIVFDSDEGSVAGSGSVSMTTHSTPARGDRLVGDEAMIDGEPDDHYIYVTYPPELKRRLLESCYNRTTRL